MNGLNLRANGHRRKALSGVVGAVILFAMVFTIGSSFFLTVNQYKHTVDQANAGRLSSMQETALENLSLSVYKVSGGSHNNWLWVEAYNTGGVPVTITAVSVTNSTGRFASLSTTSSQSPYLIGQPDLNVSLPLTLSAGVNTTAMSGCTTGKGCSIGINPAALPGYTSGTTVLVSLLTGSGNAFSAQYPAPRSTATMKNVVIVDQHLLDQIILDESVVNLQNQNVVIGCYGCDTNLMAGGNILVTQITATPSPVSNGKTITVAATVWNFSPFTASAVNVTLNSVYTGSASVTPDLSKSSGTCGSSASILSEGNALFTCTFVANSGGSNGAVSFVGSAKACDLTGTTTSCKNGVLVTSSTAASNPVQIGNIVSFGPWQLNYYYFSYTDQQHQSQTPAALIASTDHYVALYVKLTNIYNSSLTVLDGSYLQFVSPNTDVNAFMAENGTVNYASDTFTAYGCTDSPPGTPADSVAGQHCITVSPGASVTLVFAAISQGAGAGGSPTSNYWEWGTSNPAGNAGCTVQIIIVSALQSGSSYSLSAQNIPFQSVFIS